MLKNYLKVALRNLSRNFNYALINVLGLTFGMTCCIIIALYVRFELSYENFQTNRHEIYRYIPKASDKGELAMQTYTPAGMAPRLAHDFPQIRNYTRFALVEPDAVFKLEGQPLPKGSFCIADSGFFSMFSIPLVQGNGPTVLSRPATIVISSSVAATFFPGQDAIGKSLKFDDKMFFEVTGVFNDIPDNSHLKFSYLASFVSLPLLMQNVYSYQIDNILDDMGSWNYSTYLHIPHGVSNDLEYAMSEKLYHYQGVDKLPGNFVPDWLQPLPEIHFTKGIKGDTGGSGSIEYIYIFSAIAAFVLLIACFNFMNLSTALALARAKEVGLRKSIGATRHQLMFQFLGESILLILFAFVIAINIAWLILPPFNSLMGLSVSLNFWSDPSFIFFLLGFLLLTGILAGAYPAFFLSSFAPSKVLKGDKLTGGKATMRKVLTIIQFAIATFMIIGTTVVFQQMEFMKNAALGFDREHIISFPSSGELHSNYDDFKERLVKHSAIKSVTICNGVPGSTLGHWRYAFPRQDRDGVSINTVTTDYNYLDVMGLEIVQGRNLSREVGTDDSVSYLINETAAKEFFLDEPVGTPFQVMDGEHPEGTIVGVVKDYHFRSLQHKVDPLVIRIDRPNSWIIAVKMNEGNYENAIEYIRSEWTRLSPGKPFDYSFLDESYDRLYKSEEKTGILMSTFSILAVFVAGLGLTGLASFLTQQRRKEISIRKVHGASTRQVVTLLSWDFIKLVLTGFMLMVPLAWYGTTQWLQNFAYQAEIGPIIYLSAGLTVALLAFATVGYQSYKASLTNPAEVLKEP